MGGLNAHQNGSTFFKRYDRGSIILRDFLAYNNKVSVNTLPVCTGLMLLLCRTVVSLNL